jgi:Mg-chelatase subunit ChlD
MSWARNLIVGCGAASILASAACGSADVSDFTAPSAAPSDRNAGAGTISNQPSGDNAKPSDDLAACATSTAAAQAKPVTLVFAYDKSGSMNDDGKWGAAKAAMKGFFASTDAKDVSASLMFFPSGDICSLGNYAAPQVPMTKLPSATFATALDAAKPGGYTPTYAALQGAIDYAENLAQGAAKDTTVAVVMVTDGVPEGCFDDHNPALAAGAAAAAAKDIPTYVVGVGNELGSLNAIALGGGTKSAFVVSVGDPNKTQQDLTAAIQQIRASALSCDYKIPAPPNGETFDRAKVNVQYTPDAGAATSLSYNQSCAGGAGWKYDDASNPTRVLACDSTCDQIKAASGKVDIVFGCATKGGTVN